MTALTSLCEHHAYAILPSLTHIYTTMSAMSEITPDAIAEKIVSLISAVKRIPREQVSLDSSFEELAIDSLDGMNLLFEVEGAFDISIPDEQARSIRSVRQMVDGVKALLAAPGRS